MEMFQSPLGEVVKETKDPTQPTVFLEFQSPLGEVVKETIKKDSDHV